MLFLLLRIAVLKRFQRRDMRKQIFQRPDSKRHCLRSRFFPAVGGIENLGQSRRTNLLIYEKGNYQFVCGKLSKAAVAERNMKRIWLDVRVSGLAAVGSLTESRDLRRGLRYAQSLVTIGKCTSKYFSGVDGKQSVVFTR